MGEPLSLTDFSNLAIGFAMAVGFCAFLFVGSMVVPGRKLKGVKLADGSRITYTLNGLALFLLTMLVIGVGSWFGWIDLSLLRTHFWGVFVAANVLSVVMTAILFLRGRRDGHRHGGPLGPLRDLWYGVELNPSWFGVDVKMFSYRPSLIGLAVINASFAVIQWQQYGHLTTQMILYQAFTFIYVFNYFQFECGMVYTWDIVAERFGFMLVWGDYVLVPFAYSLVGWYLIDRTEPLPVWMAVGLALMFAVGLWIFRGANQQKDAFKRNPDVKIWGRKARTIGGKILVSGFWGIGRKLNYTGEIMVYWSFTLLAGDASIVRYLLPTWLIGLLTHRAWRDDKRSRQKYGRLWEQYCEKARFKMVPFVY